MSNQSVFIPSSGFGNLAVYAPEGVQFQVVYEPTSPGDSVRYALNGGPPTQPLPAGITPITPGVNGTNFSYTASSPLKLVFVTSAPSTVVFMPIAGMGSAAYYGASSGSLPIAYGPTVPGDQVLYGLNGARPTQSLPVGYSSLPVTPPNGINFSYVANGMLKLQFQVPPGAAVARRKASALQKLGKGKLDLTALRGSTAVDGNNQVQVSLWTTTYQDGQLQSFVVVDPVDPSQMIFNLAVGVLSADQKTIYTSGWAIPEIHNDQPFSPGVGLANVVWSDLFDPSKYGKTVTATIFGVVGTPDNEQTFSFTKQVNLDSPQS